MPEHINQSVAIALRMRANYIETGDVLLSKNDVADQLAALPHKREYDGDRRRLEEQLIKALRRVTVEQQELIGRLREHAARVELDG